MIVVYSTDTNEFMNNAILDRSHMAKFHHGEALTDLAESIIAAGYSFMTLDYYLKHHKKENALLISDMASGINSLSNKFITPAVSFSLESPVIATRYYHYINRRTEDFYFVLDWVGISKRITSSDKRFLEIFQPNKHDSVIFNLSNWSKKKFLVIINSNKLALQWEWPQFSVLNFFSTLKCLLRNLLTKWIKFSDPQITTQLYIERLNAIQHFSNRRDFDLFGYGWEVKNNFWSDMQAEAVHKSYRGPIEGSDDNNDKLRVLSKYKFSIVYENALFPGYLTEKIFDCFFSGVIPIYLGNPLVLEQIPKETFIDARDFTDYQDLESFLDKMTMDEAKRYLKAAEKFMLSEQFKFFTSAHFSNTIINCLNKVRSYLKDHN